MIEDFENKEDVRSSGELWTEICSSLSPVSQATPEIHPEFIDSFQPAAQLAPQVNGHSNGTNGTSSGVKWQPMEDSEIYIASLGTAIRSVSSCIYRP